MSDALTAGDRPYKATMPVERALDILMLALRSGTIDPALLDLSWSAPWKARPS